MKVEHQSTFSQLLVEKFSDTLLIMVPRENLDSIQQLDDIIVLEELDIHLRYEKYWWVSILIIPLIMLLAVLSTYPENTFLGSIFNGYMPIEKGAVFGAIILLVLKSLNIEEAYKSINWSVIFLIAALIPIGAALSDPEWIINVNGNRVNIGGTGLGSDIGRTIIDSGSYIFNQIGDSWGVDKNIIYLALLYLVTFILSSFISNAAVAVFLTPVAMVIAKTLGVNVEPLLMAVCFGASASFMTPMGYQTNMMVYGPGQYKLKDFFQMGIPLTILFWITAIYFIPKFWPFNI